MASKHTKSQTMCVRFYSRYCAEFVQTASGIDVPFLGQALIPDEVPSSDGRWLSECSSGARPLAE